MVKYHHALWIIYYIFRAKKSPIHEYFVVSKINVLNYKCEPYSSSDLPDPGSPPKKKRKSLSRKSQSCHLCPAKVKNLSLHLRNVHKKEPAWYATNYQGNIIRECPITGCGSIYARIKQHLRRLHVQDGGHEYNQRGVQNSQTFDNVARAVSTLIYNVGNFI